MGSILGPSGVALENCNVVNAYSISYQLESISQSNKRFRAMKNWRYLDNEPNYTYCMYHCTTLVVLCG